MRRKYFMRGMGFGIIITVLVVSVSLMLSGNQKMSDKAIIERAKELGYVLPDNETLSKNDKEKETEKVETEPVKDDTEGEKTQTEDEKLPEITVETRTGDEVEPAPNETNSPVSTENKTTDTKPNTTLGTTTSTTEDIIKFNIRSGENSAIVSANLYKAGLVTNPSNYDSYLEKNGYDKVLRPGSYAIRKGSSNETIAKILTGK